MPGTYISPAEAGLYYLQSRYYSPEMGRFINADNQIAGVGGDVLEYNMFAYCSNNPVNRIDPTGETWWHWALGAVVVAACAVATVVTCGGFATATTAVCLVSSGIAATTTASTIAAGAFICSSSVFGLAVLDDAFSSSSVQEFNERGNWETVAHTVGGAVSGAYGGYSMSAYQLLNNATNSNQKVTASHTSGNGSPKNNVNPGGSYTKLDNNGNYIRIPNLMIWGDRR